MNHIKQLDSLRALAVMLVIINHWNIAPLDFISPEWKDVLGSAGVDIFFVLSGFLITRILLEQRAKTQIEKIDTRLLIKNFYFRRALRIFPVYYLFVIGISLFQYYSIGHLLPEISYYVSYTTNYFKLFHESDHLSMGHLWSLAVEEQFYLVWPWLILFIDQTKVLRTILIFIAIGIASMYMLHTIKNHFYMTICCFQAFGAGGLLAWLTIFKPDLLKKAESITRLLAISGIILIILGVLFPYANFIPLRIKNTCIAFYLIIHLYQMQYNKKFTFGFFFNNPFIIYIGKISYGIYLFHISIPYVWNYLPEEINCIIPLYLTHSGIWISNFVILLAMASLSYYLVEKPFLNMKKYYN